jgi:hypothetical protein
MTPDTANSHYGQCAEPLQDDVFTLAGFTMAGPRLGKAVRERFVALAAGLLKKHGPRAFEMPKRAAAIHEAGHAIVMAILGVRITNISIDHISRDGKLHWGGNTEAPDLAFVDTPTCPVRFDNLLDRSRIVYAGLAAELLFAGDDRREGSSLDEIIMSQILAERAASLVGASAPDLWRDQVAHWCNIQLIRNRKAHADIADALMSPGRLKGKVLRELCAKVQAADDENWPDIQDHTSQLADAGITVEDVEGWV